MALAGGVGVEIFAEGRMDAASWFFGEDQGRYLIACGAEDADRLQVMALDADVPVRVVGEAGGETVKLGGSEVALAALAAAHGEALGRLLD
jgi:phosphoribosylformylglycinamidine synthase